MQDAIDLNEFEMRMKKKHASNNAFQNMWSQFVYSNAQIHTNTQNIRTNYTHLIIVLAFNTIRYDTIMSVAVSEQTY